MLLDIVILPPIRLRNRLGRLIRQAVNGYPNILVVDNKKLIPHISLFHLKVSPRDLPKIFKTIDQISKNYYSFKISSRGLRVNGQNIALRLSGPAILKKLHHEVLLKCYRLRSGTMPWTAKRKPTALERTYRKKYGSKHILKLFAPHLTLAALKNDPDANLVSQKIKKIKFNFTADTLAIGQVNFWHQVTRILKKFKLKN